MKAIEQYFHMVLLILYKVVLTSKSDDENLMCDHSNESCRAVLSCFNVCFFVTLHAEIFRLGSSCQ